jgi:hypothetical protein
LCLQAGQLPEIHFCARSFTASDAVANPPNGTCPWGWISSGSVLPALKLVAVTLAQAKALAQRDADAQG